MPSLRDLKKRLQGVRTTGQLAGAMRTVSMAKYSKANALLTACSNYAEAMRKLAGMVMQADNAKHTAYDRGEVREAGDDKPLIVLISGNRGLCGGYNHELFGFFMEKAEQVHQPYLLVTCGRMAGEFCRERGLETVESVEISDVPTFEEAKLLSKLLYGYYERGEASTVTVIHQRFINMLKQEPEARPFIPMNYSIGEKTEKSEHSDGDTLILIPDAETVQDGLMEYCIAVDTYSLLLSCASGAQAATLMAMRSAYDNAKTSAQMLETAINRRRQAKVTESVIETSSDPDNNNF